MEVFHGPLPDADAVVSQLAGFDVVVAMRERTPFPADVLRRLTRFKLLVTTGPVNAAIDLSAADAQGIVVCRTGYPDAAATSELTWALILAALRNLPAETRHVREAVGR
ncbi:hypothetical protein [Streptomyces sp. Y7]|uniref:hypothetical protein n=1 Tax=Streptomyces sp. Y7 TaxID=3342392 RepID=UPI00371B5A5A